MAWVCACRLVSWLGCVETIGGGGVLWGADDTPFRARITAENRNSYCIIIHFHIPPAFVRVDGWTARSEFEIDKRLFFPL